MNKTIKEMYESCGGDRMLSRLEQVNISPEIWIVKFNQENKILEGFGHTIDESIKSAYLKK